MSVTAASVDTLYTVVVGDSLSKLAARFYGDATKYPIIAARNNVNPSAILLAGARLIIPAIGNRVEEVQVTDAPRLPIAPSAGPTGGLPAPQGIETIVSTASVWYKDWRYWAAITAGVGILWYFTGRRRT